MIEVKGLQKHFGGLHVLNGIDEVIHDGEVVVVIGPSGSGKSTFLRCLTLLEEPTSGQVIIDGQQINAPGVDIPMVTFSRSRYTQYPEYHTSLDNMDLVSPAGFEGSFEVLTKLVDALENNAYYKINVLCEPQLGKRGLYPSISRRGQYDAVMMITNFIAYSDGTNDLFDISNIMGVPVDELIKIKNELMENGILDIVG